MEMYDDGPYEVGDEHLSDPDLVPVPANSYLGECKTIMCMSRLHTLGFCQHLFGFFFNFLLWFTNCHSVLLLSCAMQSHFVLNAFNFYAVQNFICIVKQLHERDFMQAEGGSELLCVAADILSLSKFVSVIVCSTYD